MSRQSCNKIISWFMHDPDINDQFVHGFIKAYFPHIDEPIHDVSLQHTDSSGRRRKKKEDIVNAIRVQGVIEMVGASIVSIKANEGTYKDICCVVIFWLCYS